MNKIEISGFPDLNIPTTLSIEQDIVKGTHTAQIQPHVNISFFSLWFMFFQEICGSLYIIKNHGTKSRNSRIY